LLLELRHLLLELALVRHELRQFVEHVAARALHDRARLPDLVLGLAHVGERVHARAREHAPHARGDAALARDLEHTDVAERARVRPHSSMQSDVIVSMRTVSPYFSSKIATAPRFFASSIVRISVSTGALVSTFAFTRSSTFAISSFVTERLCARSKRRMSGPT